jgi:RNA polymerase sigma factor (sigma-70 family)
VVEEEELMTTTPLTRLDGPHATFAAATCGGGCDDEALLLQFLEGDAETSGDAFRALVCRHGPMVMGVCRHVLHQDHDAEDAFQAAFLTLSQKAGTIRNRRVLAAWLYEVAYRIAVRSRAGAALRRQREREGMAMTETTSRPDQENQAAWNELRPVLHDEINRLPDKYRLPVILSYLEGRTNEEVAALLECPVGTVKGRLSRARDLLRSRLVRRGLALSAAFLCTSLSHGAVFAEVVPETLIDSTVRRVMRARWDPGEAAGPDSSDTDLLPDAIDPPSWRSLSGRRGGGPLPLATKGLVVFVLAVILTLGYLTTAFIATDQVLSMQLRAKVQKMWSGVCH